MKTKSGVVNVNLQMNELNTANEILEELKIGDLGQR